MANSKHQHIVDAVVTALSAAPAIASAVHDGRNYPLPKERVNALHVYLGDSQSEAIEMTGAPIDWETEVEILVKARRNGGTAAEKVADAVWSDAWDRVMADQSFGGLVMALSSRSVTRDRDEADTDVATLSWRFAVQHRTSNNSIAAP